MTESSLLVLVLAAIYLFECHCSASASLVAFRFRRQSRSQLASPIATLDSLRINVFRSDLLPGTGEIGFCEHGPKLSPLGLCTCGVGRGPFSAYFPFTSQAAITVNGCAVLANEIPIAEAASGALGT